MFKYLYPIVIITSVIIIIFVFRINQQNKNVYEKIETGKHVNYLIVGDSIGRSSGASDQEHKWFSLMEKSLHTKFGSSFTNHLVVQSGATAFEGLYKLKNRFISNYIDLVFIVFGENDRKYMNSEEFYFFYHSLLEEIVLRFPNAELITITESSLDNEEFIQVIENLTNKFYATNIDMRIPFQKSGLSNDQLTNDLVHPNDLGYSLYAKELEKRMKDAINNKKTVLTSTIPANEVTKLPMLTNNKFKTIDPSFTLKDQYYTTNKIGAFIEFEFKGTFLGVNVIRSEKGGMMDVYIDNDYITSLSTWWPFHKERTLYVTSGLSKGNHIVRFQVSQNKSKYNITDKHEIQISSIVVNKE